MSRLCYDQWRIFYCWMDSEGSAPISQPAKLTMWREGIQFKNLDIALPTLAAANPRNAPKGSDSTSVRLALWASTSDELSPVTARPWLAKVRLADFGHVPFPVLSMPIEISASKGKQQSAPRGSSSSHASKQEQIERAMLFRTQPLPSSPSDFKPSLYSLSLTEQTSFDLDKVHYCFPSPAIPHMMELMPVS